MKTKLFLLLTLSLTLPLLGSGPLSPALAARSVRLHPPMQVIPRTFFGMHIHHLVKGARQPTPWPSVPFGTWRLWDAFAAWPNLGPEKGKWDFATLDKYVALADQHNVEILLPLALSPPWASARPNDKTEGQEGVSAEPKDITDWQNYVRTVAERYKGKIHYYGIWNEPNLEAFYSGSIPEMVRLAEVAYQTLKRVDPAITVGSPDPTAQRGLAWFDQYLKAGGGKYADVICYHFYVNPGPPEEMVPLIQQVKQIMRDDGVGNKPVWDTETGWPIRNKQPNAVADRRPGFNKSALPQDRAAAYVARAYVLSWASGVSRLYWYAWDNGWTGLVEADGKTMKAPAIAYGLVENWLVGATMTSCGSNSKGIWTCALTRPGNYRAWIVWDPDHTVPFTVPAAWKVTEVRDLSGGSRPLGKANAITVDALPLMLVSPRS